MELLQLEYFCVVAERGSITRASEYLNVSQPSLSMTIKRLEEELGVRLFDRVGRNIKLSLCGEVFFSRTRRYLDGIHDAVREVRDLSNEPYGEVNLAFLGLENIMAELCHGFSEAYPHINLSIAADNSSQRHNIADFDLAVLASVIQTSQTTYEERDLCREEVMLAVAKKNPLSCNDCLALKDVAQYPFITIWPGSSNYENLHRLCAHAGFKPMVKMECDNFGIFSFMLESGNLIALVPATAVERLSKTKLSFIRLSDQERYRTVKLVWPRGRYLSKAANAFQDYAVKYYENKVKESSAVYGSYLTP